MTELVAGLTLSQGLGQLCGLVALGFCIAGFANKNDDRLLVLLISANVAFALIFRQDLTMVVYNSQGQLVYGEHFEDTSEFQTTIALEGWASGVYQVFVIREDGTVDLGRFVKS